MSSLAGMFLVARPTLKDPFFGRSVILMLRHGPDGAFGLVLNRVQKNFAECGCDIVSFGVRKVSDIVNELDQPFGSP